MSTLFETYENEFKHSIKVIEAKIEQLKTARNKQQVLKEINAELEIAKDSIDQMKMVATSTYGGSLNAKVKDFASQLERLRLESEKYGSRVPSYGERQRGQILEGKKVVEQTGKRLNDTYITALETEELGTIALKGLVDDGEKLGQMDTEMEIMDTKIDTTRDILSRMTRGIITNKLILIFIILVLTITISAIIYFKWLSPLIKQLTPPPVPIVVPAPQQMTPSNMPPTTGPPSTLPSPPPPPPLSPPSSVPTPSGVATPSGVTTPTTTPGVTPQ